MCHQRHLGSRHHLVWHQQLVTGWQLAHPCQLLQQGSQRSLHGLSGTGHQPHGEGVDQHPALSLRHVPPEQHWLGWTVDFVGHVHEPGEDVLRQIPHQSVLLSSVDVPEDDGDGKLPNL